MFAKLRVGSGWGPISKNDVVAVGAGRGFPTGWIQSLLGKQEMGTDVLKISIMCSRHL